MIRRRNTLHQSLGVLRFQNRRINRMQIAVNSRETNNLWAITASFGHEDKSGSLYRSTDYGKSWRLVFSEPTNFYDLVLWSKDPSKVFIATDKGI